MQRPETEAARTISARAWLAVLLMTAAALALRLAGIGFMLPHTPNVDEQVLTTQVSRERHVEALPVKAALPFAYPTLLGKLAEVTTRSRARRVHDTLAQPKTIEEHVADAAAQIVGIRALIAILSSLAVPLTFLVARRFLTDPGALIAAAFVTVSVLHEWYSSQARPHGALCTLTMASVLASLELRRRGRLREYLIAGVAAALAVGCLQSGIIVLPALAVALVLAEDKAARVRFAWIIPAVLVAVAFFVFYRFVDAPPEGSAVQGDGILDHVLNKMHGLALEDFRGHGFAAMPKALWSYDPLISVLALAGLVVLVVRGARARAVRATRFILGTSRAKDLAVVLAHAVPHVIAFGLFERTFQRFLLPVVPYLCMLAAFAVLALGDALASRASGRTSRAAWASLPALAFVCVQSYAAVRVALLKLAPDTEELAAAWIRANSKPGEALTALAPSLDLPLVRTRETIPETRVRDRIAFNPWTEYQLLLSPSECARVGYDLLDVPLRKAGDRAAFERDPIAHVRGLGARWVVVEVQHDGRRQLLQDLHDAVRSCGTLVARFAPRSGRDDDLPITYALDGPWAPERDFAWRAARFDRQGPDIEIYAMTR